MSRTFIGALKDVKKAAWVAAATVLFIVAGVVWLIILIYGELEKSMQPEELFWVMAAIIVGLAISLIYCIWTCVQIIRRCKKQISVTTEELRKKYNIPNHF